MGLNLCDSCRADCRHERNPREIVIKCGAYKPPMTNADRIRAMSDKELARFLAEVEYRRSDCRWRCNLERNGPRFRMAPAATGGGVTAMADYVCEGCIHAPPGSGDGKPCCMCDMMIH